MYALYTFVRPSCLTSSLYVTIKKQVSNTARNEIQVFHSVSLAKLAIKNRTEGVKFATGANLVLPL